MSLINKVKYQQWGKPVTISKAEEPAQTIFSVSFKCANPLKVTVLHKQVKKQAKDCVDDKLKTLWLEWGDIGVDKEEVWMEVTWVEV